MTTTDARAQTSDGRERGGVASFVVRRGTLLIFLLALLVRLYAVAAHPAEPGGDAADYHRLAQGLAQGAGYVNGGGDPTAWRPPGYPAFLACVYALFGASVGAAAVAQAVLGAFTVLLLMLLARQVAGRREGVAAGLLAAVYPGFFWLPRLLLSENLALFLTLAALCAAVALARRWSALGAVGLGLLLGLGAYVRFTHLMLAVVLLLWLAAHFWMDGRRWRRALATAALAGAAMGLLILPWAVRNYRLFGKPVLATQDGLTFYSSYWPPERDGRFIWGTLPGREDPAVVEAEGAGDEAAVSDRLRAVALGRLRERPGHYFRLLPSKFLSLLAPFDWETFPHAPGSTRSANPVYALAVIAAMLGVFALRRRRAPLRLVLWVVPLAVAGQVLVSYGSPRFRLPAESSAVVWAAAALVWLWDVRGPGRRGSE
ncbi:MAG TPA: glycosyltransferase family 39 protein [Pyrinomonadaceae bacterium]|jgi:4-amino-4-deoxy-L-arabinose transferase-like glycosyltransferase|nr:glycosyltransferase family 39 protein [Pyrinomonadaceae bacterium]